MLLPPLASLEALSERLGVVLLTEYGDDPTSPDGVRAAAALDDASALIRSEAGKDWVDENNELDSVPAVVEAICLAVAYRTYRNPDGTSQASVGDVSVSYARDGVAGAVFLTRAEVRQIRKAAGRNSYGSIGLETPYVVAGGSPFFVPTEGGGDLFPIGPFPWEAT